MTFSCFWRYVYIMYYIFHIKTCFLIWVFYFYFHFFTWLQGTLTIGCILLKTFRIWDWWIQYEGVLHLTGFWIDISCHQFLIFNIVVLIVLQFKSSFSQYPISWVLALSSIRKTNKYVFKNLRIILNLREKLWEIQKWNKN